jgi:hypothetical protein
MKTSKTKKTKSREYQEALAISRACLAKGKDFGPEKLLKDKCNSEGMTRTAVIIEFGDPRNWKT